ncbi:MAG: hypothetical protein A2X49_10260 [Lentisphaerae bacterium GWF2_52_8]|nr:MAG: hypothetical protein A2X49_10260 [Lentisphaerae bacterium GWF2_52_8]
MTKKVELEGEITLTGLIRLFYKYEVEYFPVINRQNRLSGFLCRNELLKFTSDTSKMKLPLTEIITESSKMLDTADGKRILRQLMREDCTYKVLPLISLAGHFAGYMTRTDLFNMMDGEEFPVSKGLYRVIFDNLPAGVMLVSDKGKILYANMKFMEITGIKSEFLRKRVLRNIPLEKGSRVDNKDYYGVITIADEQFAYKSKSLWDNDIFLGFVFLIDKLDSQEEAPASPDGGEEGENAG